MPKFSQQSLDKLAQCVKPLQVVAAEAIKHYDFTVITGFRGKEEQNAAWLRGDSQKKWPNGEHNAQPSRAVDIAPWPVDWSDAEKATQRFVLLAGIWLAIGWDRGIDLRWGGDWNKNGDTRDEHFRDYGHFEVDG